MYKIEVYSEIDRQWMEMPGQPGYNEWATEAEAEEIIKTLDPEAKYHVVES